jgi:hypothetical protein
MAGTTKTLRHAARIMKLTAILLIGACIQVHAVGFGQKISLLPLSCLLTDNQFYRDMSSDFRE